MQIGILDWVVIGLYLAVLAAIGIAASRRARDTSQYFLGKRRFGKLLMMAQSFGVGTHADMPVSLAGAVYRQGISAIWFQWKNLFAMPFYWIMAPIFRRVRRTTIAEMMEDRYGTGMAGLYVVFSFVFFVINIASILKGAAKILFEVFGGHPSVNQIVLILAAIFILYSFIGGLLASTWSDFMQGLLIIVLSFMLIPLGWNLVGGMSGMKQVLPASSFSLAAPKEIGLWFIAMLTLNGIVGIMAQPHMMAAVGTGKDEYACRVGFFHGTLIKRICTVGWAIVGIMVLVMVKKAVFGVNALSDPEDAFGFACRHLLSSGTRGLLIASVMGAGLASCSALMIDSGALFTEGLYRPHLVRRRSDQHYLWVGRLSGLITVVVAILYALFLIREVLYSFLLTETLATYVGISLVAGVMWKRANRWGAIASIVVSLATNFYLYSFEGKRLDFWDPNIFLASLAAGVLSLVVVSLLTRREPAASIDAFFSRLDTPSDLSASVRAAVPVSAGRPSTGEEQLLEQIPGLEMGRERLDDIRKWSAEHGRQLLFVNLFHLRRGTCGVGWRRAYHDDLKGLLIGFLLCGGLVGGLWLFLQF